MEWMDWGFFLGVEEEDEEVVGCVCGRGFGYVGFGVRVWGLGRAN